ncbi:MAG TPA: hypothetical protein VF556_07740 [Pyrinomonadaceae bacterium]|jgi:hypothetical protein
MSNNTYAHKEATFDCEKCNQTVTFYYVQKQIRADEFDAVLHTVPERIISYGKCRVAVNARIPNNPNSIEMEQCPCVHKLK